MPNNTETLSDRRTEGSLERVVSRQVVDEWRTAETSYRKLASDYKLAGLQVASAVSLAKAETLAACAADVEKAANADLRHSAGSAASQPKETTNEK